MSAKHRLTPPAEGRAGLLGKHPALGDFLPLDLPQEIERALTDWLGQTLAGVREMLGDAWSGVAAAPALRFWIGAAVLGHGPWQGVMRMSQDKVGRRYPLAILQPCTPDDMPTLAPDQTIYDAAARILDAIMARPDLPPHDMLAATPALLEPLGTPPAPVSAQTGFWALNPACGTAELWSGLGPADYASAAAGRSYWWFEAQGDTPAGALACHGLPDAAALAWLLAGGRGTFDGASADPVPDAG